MMPQPPAPWDLLLRPQCVTRAQCKDWLAAFDAVDGADADAAVDPAERQPSSGSLRLRALGEVLFGEVLHTVWRSPAGRAVRVWLGAAPACLLAQCWLRHQPPAWQRAPGHHPHQWHQDGALGCRFPSAASTALPAEALAPLVTVWIPLLPCGADAPSLEWIDQPTPGLLPPADLSEAAVAARFDPVRHRQARLAAGDALVFGPALLHRTHVRPTMQARRVSVELRFAVADRLPPRLADEPLRQLR